MKSLLQKLFGANYATTLTAAGAAISAAITFLSTVSYDQGPIALIVPIAYKPVVAKLAGISTLVLWVWNGYKQKSKEVAGGSIVQDQDGNVAKPQLTTPPPPQPAVPAMKRNDLTLPILLAAFALLSMAGCAAVPVHGTTNVGGVSVQYAPK